MIQHFASEPLLGRLLLQRRAIHPKGLLLIALILAVVNLYLITLIASNPYGWIASGWAILLLLTICMIVVSSPIVTAVFAAIWTSHEVSTESYQLLHMTLLPNSKIARTYRLFVLYRLRILLLVVVGLTPVFIYGLYHTIPLESTLTIFYGPPYVPSGSYFQWMFPLRHNGKWIMLAFLSAVSIGLWGIHLFAATLSVWFGFSLRNTLVAAAASALLTPLIAGGVILITLASFSHIFNNYFPLILMECGLIALIPYGLTTIAMQLSQYWVRKSD